MSKKRLLLIELNEFDPDFLQKSARQLHLSNILKALAFQRSNTFTQDEVEHQGLDPWVQWVNVHSGVESAVHGVKRLGETRHQTIPQIWTVLGKAGLTWGAWGVMNAPRQDAPGCQFFFPDPWSFEEMAAPAFLNDLLALPRYVARNYLDIDALTTVRHALGFVRFMAAPRMWGVSSKFARSFIRNALSRGVSIHSLSTFLDYLSTLAFVEIRKKQRPDFSVIFLNNIAHLQHQFWSRSSMHPEMELGLKLTDRMLGLLLADLDETDAVILMNGLKQRNVEGEGYCVYRQKNPQAFVDQLGLKVRVEQCMTNDAHVICDTAEDADMVEAALRTCRLGSGGAPFFVERIAPERVFFQMDLDREVADDERLVFAHGSLPFRDSIELYARRTGAHIQSADLYAMNIDAPGTLPNHEVFDLILSYFGVKPALGRQVLETV